MNNIQYISHLYSFFVSLANQKIYMTTLNIIQTMLAPALMISGCGLLLLSQNNKYSNVITRIRVLDEERRRIKHTLETTEKLSQIEEKRLKNINIQSVKLFERVRYVRNTVLSYTLAVGAIILSCLALGIQIMAEINLSPLVLGLFMIGMAFVLLGVFYGVLESNAGYKIISIEINEDI